MQEASQKVPQVTNIGPVQPGQTRRTAALRIQDPFVEKTITGASGADYKIQSRIGAGGMGVVYDAACKDTRVAVKFIGTDLAAMDPFAIKRLQIEAHSMGQIDHPNVVKIYDYGVYETRTFIVMELLKGASLDAKLDRLLGWDVIRNILLQACDGLAAAHEKGIIHRDIKPPNIFILEGEPLRIKLIDFGTAKVLGSRFTTITRTGMVVGTLHYMAPEMLDETPPPQAMLPRVDVYSTGAVLYQLLTGQVPFDGPNLAVLQSKISMGDYVLPRECAPHRGIPKSLEDVVRTALAVDPYERFSSMSELREAIADIEWDGMPPSGIGRRVLMWVGIPLALIGAAGASAWYFQKPLTQYYRSTVAPYYYSEISPLLERNNLPHPELPGTQAAPPAVQPPKPALAPVPHAKQPPQRVHRVTGVSHAEPESLLGDTTVQQEQADTSGY